MNLFRASRLRGYLVFLTLLGFVHCSSRNYNKDIASAEELYFQRNDPLGASKLLLPQVNTENEDQILYMFEAGTLLQAAGKYETSSKVFRAAQARVEQKIKSVSTEVFSLLSNDRGKVYYGEDHEIVLLHSFEALNSLARQDFEEAFISIRKSANFLESLRQEKAPLFQFNAFAKYLSYPAAFSSRDSADLEYALVEMRQAAKVFPQNAAIAKAFYDTAIMLQEKGEAERLRRRFSNLGDAPGKNHGKLIFVAETGIAPVKVSRGRLLDEPGMRLALRVAIDAAIITQSAEGVTVTAAMAALASADHPIPRYKKRKFREETVVLKLTDSAGKEFILEPVLLNDVQETVRKNFEQKYEEIKSKMVQRIAVKLITTLVAQQAAKAIAKKATNNSGLSTFIGAVAGIATGVAVFSTEKPDLRCWHTLPALLYGGSVDLPEGQYDVQAEYQDAHHQQIRIESLAPITITKNKTAFRLLRTAR